MLAKALRISDLDRIAPAEQGAREQCGRPAGDGEPCRALWVAGGRMLLFNLNAGSAADSQYFKWSENL